MRPLRLPPVRVVVRAPEVLQARARALSVAVESRPEVVEERFVSFRAANVACALELTAVEKAVVRLGEVVPLARAPLGSSILGLAFVDNLPRLVVDLACLDAPRPLEELSQSPALLVRLQEVSFAVSVQGPVELTEAEVTNDLRSDLALGSEARRIAVDGRLKDGTLRISSAWFKQWVEGLRATGSDV